MSNKRFILFLIVVLIVSMGTTAVYVTYAANKRDITAEEETRKEIERIKLSYESPKEIEKAPSISADTVDVPLPTEREEPAMVISANWATNKIVIKLIESSEIFSFYEEEGANDWFAQDGCMVTLNDNGTPWDITDDQVIDAVYADVFNYWFDITYDEWLEWATPEFTEEEIALCAGVIAHEANSDWISTEEKACIVWAILNRVDDKESPDFRNINTIEAVVNQSGQMTCYRDYEHYSQFLWLAEDVLWRHQAEREGLDDCGRVLPKEYRFWWGDGSHNHFRVTNDAQVYWDYSLSNPYEGGEIN